MGAGPIAQGPGRGQVLDAAEVVRDSRPGPHRAGPRARRLGAGPVGDPVGQGNRHQPVSGPGGAGGQHLAPVGMDAGRHPHGLPARGGHAQVDGLDRGTAAVVERGVGHRQPGQPGHHGLVLEDRLQHPLGHLGLVGRVGGDELGASGEGPGHRRDLVVVGAAAGEADQAVGSGPVPVGEPLHGGQDVGLAHAGGQLEPALEPQGLGDHVEQLVDRGETEEGQHALDLVVGVRDVGAHGATPPVLGSLVLVEDGPRGPMRAGVVRLSGPMPTGRDG